MLINHPELIAYTHTDIYIHVKDWVCAFVSMLGDMIRNPGYGFMLFRRSTVGAARQKKKCSNVVNSYLEGDAFNT